MLIVSVFWNNPIIDCRNHDLLNVNYLKIYICRPLAYDRDDGINGELNFSLKSSNPGLFQICPSTGTVYSTRPLVDPEREYHILIKATDKGEKFYSKNIIFHIKFSGLFLKSDARG